jgi:hypothetical protein
MTSMKSGALHGVWHPSIHCGSWDRIPAGVGEGYCTVLKYLWVKLVDVWDLQLKYSDKQQI